MMRDYVCGGRGRGWREAHGCTALEDFTAERAVEFLDWYRDDIGAMKETVRKVRNHLRRFARWTALPVERGGLGLGSLSRPPLTTYEVRRLGKAERQERRHTFCTWYAEGGGEPFHLMYLMGHASLTMVARYFRGRLNKSLMEAAARIRV